MRPTERDSGCRIDPQVEKVAEDRDRKQKRSRESEAACRRDPRAENAN
jgi:hypothetical protein